MVDPNSFFYRKDNHSPDWLIDSDTEEWGNSYWGDDPIGPKKRGLFTSYQNITAEYLDKITLGDEHFFLFNRDLCGFTPKTRQWRKLFLTLVQLIFSP